jgi:hypothetical protein
VTFCLRGGVTRPSCFCCAISSGYASYLPVSGASTHVGSLALTALRLAAALAFTSPCGMRLSENVSINAVYIMHPNGCICKRKMHPFG